ncbi:MAG: hypothetical protein GY909_16525 [Oligoflexia bacterium]|nr:hypothetical protein [Oligoflexia bacterium]
MYGKRDHLFIKLIIGLFLLVGFSSCVQDDGRKGRPLISLIGSEGGESSECTEFFDVTSLSCVSQCRLGTHVADESEVQDLFTQLELQQTSQTLIDEIAAQEQSSQGLCIEGSGVLRPSGAVFVKKDFCGCLNGKPDTVNNCAGFCSSKNVATSTLYGSVDLGPDVQFNNDLGNLENWCNNPITGSTLSAPGCFLEVYDGSSTQQLPIILFPDSNNFEVNISQLEYGKVYVSKIVESQSGSDAETSSFQIFRKDQQTTENNRAPLRIMPVSQYTCISRTLRTIDNTSFFEDFFRIHFYFSSDATPPSLPPGIKNIVCHDINQLGEDDSPLYPRLELIPQHMAVWDQSDPQFVDADSDGRADINTVIEQRLLDEASIQRTLTIFSPFPWPNMPTIPNFNDGNNTPNLGFYMQPWIDPITGDGFCPDQDDYNGNDPIFKILKEVVGVDTEAIYLAESEPRARGDGSFVQDVLMIRENLLNKIWFYFENGQHFVPDEISSKTKTIHFYWPADPVNPYIRKSEQTIYTIRHPSNIGTNGVPASGLVNQTRPPDKRFGCIPALD